MRLSTTMCWKATKNIWSPPEIYIYTAPNNSNVTHTFIRLGSTKTALKLQYEIQIGQHTYNSMYGAGYKLEK